MVHIWIIVHNQITNIRYSFNVKAYLFSFTSLVGYFDLYISYVHVLHTVLQPKHLLLCHCIVIHPFFWNVRLKCRWWPAVVDGYSSISLWGRHKAPSWNHYRRCRSSLAKWCPARMASSTAAHYWSQSRCSFDAVSTSEIMDLDFYKEGHLSQKTCQKLLDMTRHLHFAPKDIRCEH